MDIVSIFRNYLFSQKHKPSIVTVKNYLSDIRKFLAWFQYTYHQNFNPSYLTNEVVEKYKADLSRASSTSTLASRSSKRYISSLHKFARFLEHSGAIKANPFNTETIVKQADDPWELKRFALHLANTKASKITIKNYIHDIKQFIDWIETVSLSESNSNNFDRIDAFAILQFKDRLLTHQHFSPVSINRKLSSLRRYIKWLQAAGLVKNNIPFQEDQNATKQLVEADQVTKSADLPITILKDAYNVLPQTPKRTYASFGPLRFFQKSRIAFINTIDYLFINNIAAGIETIQYYLWKRSGKEVFKPVNIIVKAINPALSISEQLPTTEKIATKVTISILPLITAKALPLLNTLLDTKATTKPYSIRNISKEFYAPLSLSIKHLPWDQQLVYHIKYTRPAWYKQYHSHTLVHKLHFAILIIATTIAALSTFLLINDPQTNEMHVFASPQTSPPRTIAFQGRLLDKTNTPITAESTLRFAIYNSPTASQAAMLWQEVQDIKPTNDGNFTTTLGKKATINQDIFSNNNSLFVGITIANDTELKPRQQLPTTSFSANSQTLQGLKVITQTDKIANVVLALDSTGNLTIGGSSSPIFQATGGQFTVSGQTLLLTTNQGSNGNIILQPDGSGIIDAQKPFQNTSNYVNASGIQGAVNINDTLAITSSSSSDSALVINQNSRGDIISGNSGLGAKFKVNNQGDTLVAGSLTVNGNTITSSNTSFGILNNNVTTLSIGSNANFMTLSGATGITVINNSLNVKGSTSVDGKFDVQGKITANGGITIPSGKSMTFIDLKPGSIPYINSTNQIAQDSAFSWSTTQKALQLNGSLCVKTSGSCTGNTAGTIYASNATVQAADVAENYVSAENLEPGDIVMPEGKNNNASIIKTQAAYEIKTIGIVSTNPGFTLNSDVKTDKDYPNTYPLALQGRVPIKVTTSNGNIKAGDPLTSSTIPGIAMKATKPGQIVAKALEDYSNSDTHAIQKIMSFVNVTYASPTPNVTDSGDIDNDNVSNTLSPITSTRIGKNTDAIVKYLLAIEDKAIVMLESTTQSFTTLSNTFKENAVDMQIYLQTITNTTLQQTTNTNQRTPHEDPSLNLSLPIPHPTLSKEASASAIISSASASADPLYNSISSQSAETIMPSITEDNSHENHTTSQNQTNPPSSINPELLQMMLPQPQLPASAAAELGIDKIDTSELHVTKSLNVTGRATFEDVGITGNVSIGLLTIHGLSNTNEKEFASINTLSGPLKLQSDGFNGIDLVNGKVTLDTQGNLKVNGNALFAKDVTVLGNLAADTIAPVPGKDLIVKLQSEKENTSLSVTNKADKTILQVSQNGDIQASGSGGFANITIVRGAQADTSLTQSISNASAGKSIIKAKQTERTIVTNFVTKNSLIYVTATSDTQKMVPYVARQTAYDPAKKSNGSFTIQIPNVVNKDITFNWWIVN